MRIAVIGANGQLGEDVVAAFSAQGHSVTGLNHEDIEITSPESIAQAFERVQPEIVVNTAAFHNVERCETEAAKAYLVNAIGAKNVARATDACGAKLLHISTDYVFDGAKRTPYVEEDTPFPLGVYANTKLAGEYFVRCNAPRHFVVRVSGIYGAHPCRAKGGLNFVEMMLKLAKERDELRVVDDEFVTPTPTDQIAKQLEILARTNVFGIYHATAEGSCSWYEFAKAIFEISGAKVRLERARPGEFAAKVARPKYSVLENAALKRLGLNVFTHWREGLENYFARREQVQAVNR